MLNEELIKKIHVKFNTNEVKGFVCWDCDKEINISEDEFTKEQLSKFPINIEGNYAIICSDCDCSNNNE